MTQKQKEKKESITVVDPKLAQELDSINAEAKPKKAAMRKVRLKYKSCCGCGCNYYDVTRMVPFDDLLKDGDRIKEIKPSDDFEEVSKRDF